MPIVAIVHSTAYGDNNKDCFDAGINATGAAQVQTSDFPARGNYAQLQQKVTDALAVNPDLIVAAGGVIAANAAAAVLSHTTDKPYIFLTGDLSVTNVGPTNVGGVDLNCSAGNPARLTLLGTTFPGLNLANVYLVVNNNAPMSGHEVQQWQQAGNNHFKIFFQNSANPPENAANPFGAEVAALAASNPRPSGLVISADPCFRYHRAKLAQAIRANGTLNAVRVCYPFREFADNGSHCSLDRPQLSLPVASSAAAEITATAYYQLGRKAGTYLNTQQNAGVVKWDFTQNNWANEVLKRSRP